ncbi:hypothetical protein [Staphylococcus aureus]|nr:hypothetical protein [Staphylococcus aureus]CCC88056.1 hypothetical protein SARLGA251_12880 [Staphylococcus aureus subsp. aureus LGA251]SCS51192.1 Uncharacterised protein [Staphylococcus aureus]SCT56498.1 Uncharacterised protein [Staphylococcus aureus]SCT59622.1 Uncharacterised protein [Staphylococcus aureus]SCT63833.1 Uncharacterised protein [Staphylococcus aureus]
MEIYKLRNSVEVYKDKENIINFRKAFNFYFRRGPYIFITYFRAWV